MAGGVNHVSNYSGRILRLRKLDSRAGDLKITKEAVPNVKEHWDAIRCFNGRGMKSN